MFIHLRSHSYYSFLEGLASPAELAQTAARHGMPGLGLTDHHGLSGGIEFYTACKDADVQPLLGLEIDVTPPGDLPAMTARSAPLALFATDMKGWGSLCRLSSLVMADAAASPLSIPCERLAEEANGLLCLSGGRRSMAAILYSGGNERGARAYLEFLRSIFSERFYVELQYHAPEDRPTINGLVRLSKQLELPIVASHGVFYLTPDQAELQRLVSGIRLIQPFESLPAEAFASPESYFIPPEVMETRFAELPQALAATQEIAERCQLVLPLGIPQLPELPLPAGQTAIEVLYERTRQGAIQLYGSGLAQKSGATDELPAEIQGRLEHELTVIEACGYASLFLIVAEILSYARRQGVPVSSRGSAASSLVAHCLGITSPDPVRLNLYFERFLNPARATPPDIDTDLCSRRRDGVIQHVYEQYGSERVAMVCTLNRFRHRSALREVAKAYGLDPDEVNTLAKNLPQRWYGPLDADEENQPPFAGLAKLYPAPLYQLIFRDAEALLGKPHHLSIHPGGVVIAPGRLTDLAPTQMASKGVVITQFDLESIERLGLVKIELLGIRGLTVLGDVAEVMHAQQPGRFATPSEGLEAIAGDDPFTAELVCKGGTIGCFQIESPGMRATLREIQASSVDDIMVALALYRPGPLSGGLKDAFVRRHLGQEIPEHLHPSLATLLADTYGVILYQEQVLRIAHELAGLSLAESDLLRRAMSHFDPGKQMQTLKEKFIRGALAKNAVPEDVAERVWELMAAFAGYGFPKAHAASYAQVSWRAAWCKVHFPAVFMAAVLANWGGYYSQRVYLTEARRMKLALHPPHVNHARREFSTSFVNGEAALFMGLDQVRDLTGRTQARILNQRPFRSLEDFLVRVDPRPAEAVNLARCGALEGFGTIPVLLDRLAQGGWQGGQYPLFTLPGESSLDWSRAKKAAAQEAVLGASVIAHPLELVESEIAASGALTSLEAANRLGQRVRLAGMRQSGRRFKTGRGELGYFMSLEDLEGMLDVIFSAQAYRRSRSELSGAGPYILEGVLEMDSRKGEPFLRAERLWRIIPKKSAEDDP